MGGYSELGMTAVEPTTIVSNSVYTNVSGKGGHDHIAGSISIDVYIKQEIPGRLWSLALSHLLVL